ncbi:f67262ca-f7eb-468b-a89e-a332fde3d996 [Thermothielavioides terrestris]|uniref:F67262ca-f7eb-468b-a89e-a332fde3d996 n=1 Tax=Thermothielavioides terrestris TaxID=2587410 RepID=A0A3S4B8D1_9PEZI|nr:f67262ca-f7eb-468b-a89e-a332fde3d996 [Thermothielavioides terrestris]
MRFQHYLLEGSAGQSLWHRIDAAEVWHYYAGAPLTLSLSFNNGTGVRRALLGPDVFRGQQPQVAIGSWEWQSAKSEGDWTLVGTTVAPAFDPNLYEIADANWHPK